MKNNLITIAYASKGRIKNGVDFLFKNKKLKIFSRGSRNLFGYIKKKPNIQIMYMKSKEIIHSLGTGICDIGISGIDLWLESEPSIQSKIKIIKKYDFSHAELCIAIPSIWIDCVNTTDLEEILL